MVNKQDTPEEVVEYFKDKKGNFSNNEESSQIRELLGKIHGFQNTANENSTFVAKEIVPKVKNKE